jgi:selenocysteine-specific elongation factor
LRELLFAQGRLLNLEDFRLRVNLRTDEVEQLMETLRPSGIRRVTAQGADLLIAETGWRQALEQIGAGLSRWHKEHPDEVGIKPALLRKRIALGERDTLFVPAVTELSGTGEVVYCDGLLRHKSHRANVSGAERALFGRVEKVLQHHGLQIPAWSSLLAEAGLPEKELQRCVDKAVRDRRLHKVGKGRYALPQVLALFARIVANLGEGDGEGFTVIEFRDQAGCGRNLAIEVLEYLDARRITVRKEQKRKILNSQLLNELMCG